MHVSTYDHAMKQFWYENGGTEIDLTVNDSLDASDADYQVYVVTNEVTLAAALVSLLRQPETTVIVFGHVSPGFNARGVIIEIRVGWPEAKIVRSVTEAVTWLKQHEHSTRE